MNPLWVAFAAGVVIGANGAVILLWFFIQLVNSGRDQKRSMLEAEH